MSLEKYKNKISEIEVAKKVAESKIDEALDKLEEDYGINTITKAKKRLSAIEPEKKKIQGQIDKLQETIEEKLEEFDD